MIMRMMKKMTNIKFKNKGFTLIELVMVLAIIGLLSSVMMPNFSAIQVKAKEHSMASIGRSLQVSLETCFLKNGIYISGKNVAIEALMKTLKENDVLPDSLLNPFTKEDFVNDDSSGKIIYSWDADTGRYSLEIYGHENEEVIKTFSNS